MSKIKGKMIAILTGIAIIIATPYIFRDRNKGDFSGEKAYNHVIAQCKLGPRPPGTQAHEKCIEYICNQLKNLEIKPQLQNFTWTDTEGNKLKLCNIIAVINPGSRYVLIGAHYDTRPRADMDIGENRSKPIIGANDGASGVAILLELARVLKNRNLKIGVKLIFFDGEDWGINIEDYFLGSKYYVSNLNRSERSRIEALILLDMVGDRDLQIYIERNSYIANSELVEKIWKTAKNLGYGKKFIWKQKYNILDDHIPFINAGIKAVDIIDFDYPYWHTLQDTIDKVLPKSLEIVGKVVENVIINWDI